MKGIENPRSLNEWKNVISINVHSKGKARLTIQDIKDIAVLYEDIQLLEKHGITSKNYMSKVKGYFKFREKAFEEYGIELDALYPFKNPTSLYEQIQKILIKVKLNQEQIKAFYAISKIRYKVPRKKNESQEVCLKSDHPNQYLDEENLEIEQQKWDELSIREQLEILGITDAEYIQTLNEQEYINKSFKQNQKLKKIFTRIQI